MIQYVKRFFGMAPSLRFDRIRGFGLLACADCGHDEEITAFNPGRDDTCYGQQCQACGAFAGLSRSNLNNEISFRLVQRPFCRNPQFHGSEPSPKKS